MKEQHLASRAQLLEQIRADYQTELAHFQQWLLSLINNSAYSENALFFLDIMYEYGIDEAVFDIVALYENEQFDHELTKLIQTYNKHLWIPALESGDLYKFLQEIRNKQMKVQLREHYTTTATKQVTLLSNEIEKMFLDIHYGLHNERSLQKEFSGIQQTENVFTRKKELTLFLQKLADYDHSTHMEQLKNTINEVTGVFKNVID